MLPPLLALGGPTGVGKSAVAFRLAQIFAGEIVSADSRMVYRQMPIGTDTPPPWEQAAIPHHLIALVDPDAPFTLAEYQRRAYAAIAAIHARGRLPILVGGTPLYLSAILEGWQLPDVPPDPAFRARLEARAAVEGSAALHAELTILDPDAAARILPTNTRRLVRALEVVHQTGRRFSEQQGKTPPPYRIGKLALSAERGELHHRIDRRVEREVADGLVEEVASLLARSYGWDLPAMTGLGYRQFRPYLEGTASLDQALQQLKWDTHSFVRHQYTWFRRDPTWVWIDTTAGVPWAEIEGRVRAWLAGDTLGDSQPAALPERLARRQRPSAP